MTKEQDSGVRFQGVMPYPVEDKIDDWGLNAEQQVNHSADKNLMVQICEIDACT
jgi:hypothetical protein